jgi:hypothetical protein
MVVIYGQMVSLQVTLGARLFAYGAHAPLVRHQFVVLSLIDAVQSFLDRKPAVALVVRLMVASEYLLGVTLATARCLIVCASGAFLAAKLGDWLRRPAAQAHLFVGSKRRGGWTGFEVDANYPVILDLRIAKAADHRLVSFVHHIYSTLAGVDCQPRQVTKSPVSEAKFCSFGQLAAWRY